MKGTVITARGEVLNMDQLIADAYAPIRKVEHSTVKEQVVPNKVRPMNVRGYKPSLGEGMKVGEPEVKTAVSKPVSKDEPKSLAEMTGLKIDKPKFAKDKPEDVVASSEEALNDILGELNTRNNTKIMQDYDEIESGKSSRKKK